MDYRFTFQDGSEVLMHYGVKGMKWGVWNAETAARHRGGGRPSKTSKTEVLTKQKDQRYQAMKTGYADGKRLRKKNNIKTGPKNIAKDTDKIDSVYKQALHEYKFNKGSNAVGAKEYGEGLLSGLIGTKDPSNEYKKLRTGKTRISQEKRTSKLDRYDDKIVKASEKQKQASSKYGADSRQNKKALKKYGKAKDRFESEYEKLNPERARLYRD